MSDDLLLVDDADGIRTITLDRPEAKNALTLAMRLRLCELLSEAEQDPATRVVVIGAVDPVFSAGVDFKEVAATDSPKPWTAFDAQFNVKPEIKQGPQGGRYTEGKTKDGRPYRRYF